MIARFMASLRGLLGRRRIDTEILEERDGRDVSGVCQRA